MKFDKNSVSGVHVPLAAFAVALAVMAFPYSPTKTVEARGGSGCEGDVKIEGDFGEFTAPTGFQIDFVCIKAGKNTFTFYPGDSGDGCYNLDWTCRCNVTVSGGGTGRDCKEISHIAVTFKPGDCPWG